MDKRTWVIFIGMTMTFPDFRTTLHRSISLFALLSVGLTSFSVATPALAGAPGGTAFGGPPDAKAGECFARVMIPAQYETLYKDVVVDEGGSQIQVSDARFAAQNQQILIRDAGTRYAVRQPVYKAVHEQIVVRPGYERLAVGQAQYRTVSEQVVVAPARKAWKPGKSLADWSGVKATKNNHGEVYCLVEIPAETKTVQKRVQIAPQSLQRIAVPPVYRTITRHVLVDPGGVSEIPMPAQYANITTQRMVQRAGSHSIATAPRSQRIAYRKMIAAERYAWIRVLCKTNATPTAITNVQTHLQNMGYYHGQLDGQLGLSTETAVREYQQSVGIPHGGYLSLDTIEALEGGRTQPVTQTLSSMAQAHAYAGSSVSNMSRQTGLSHGEDISFIPANEAPANIIPGNLLPQHHTIVTKRRLTWAGKS